MRFYKDKLGINDLEIESDKHVIADFFSSDIQGSTYNLNVSVEACKAVANHEIPEWEGKGRGMPIPSPSSLMVYL